MYLTIGCSFFAATIQSLAGTPELYIEIQERPLLSVLVSCRQGFTVYPDEQRKHNIEAESACIDAFEAASNPREESDQDNFERYRPCLCYKAA